MTDQQVDNQVDNGAREINRDVVEFDKPSQRDMSLMTAPLRAYFRPRFFGMDNIDPARPALFVGNHTIFGLLDVPLMTAEVYKEKGILIRGLADHAHFEIPGWRDVMASGGGVEGTRPNCRALMEAGESIVVFPGGGREVAKRKGEAYKLVWKQRKGFTRMAIEYGYPIIPFASVGPDDAFDILVDGDEIMASPVGRFLTRTGLSDKYLRGGDMLMPIARGFGLTAFPRPERFYFKFGKPISTKKYAGLENDDDALMDLREKTARAINREIDALQEIRAEDDRSGLIPRLVSFRRRRDV